MAEPLHAALARYLASPAVAAWLLDPAPVTSVTLGALDNAFVYAISFGVAAAAAAAAAAGAAAGAAAAASKTTAKTATAAAAARDVEDMLITTRVTPDGFALGVVFGLAQPHVFSSTPLMLDVRPITRRFAVDLRATDSLEFMELTHFRDRKVCCCFRNFLHTPDGTLPVAIRATLHAPPLPLAHHHQHPVLQQKQQQREAAAAAAANCGAAGAHAHASSTDHHIYSSNNSSSTSTKSCCSNLSTLSVPSIPAARAETDPGTESSPAAAALHSDNVDAIDDDLPFSLTPHILGPVLMRAESFEAVSCPVCGNQHVACVCSFHDKCSFVSAPVFIRGWGHFTSRFVNKARYGRNGTIRLTMWANVPALGETKVLERDLSAQNFLYQDKNYLVIMRRKAVHGLGLSVQMPRVDEPLFATAEATDFLNLHEQYVVSSGMTARKRRSTSFATASRVTSTPPLVDICSYGNAPRLNLGHECDISPVSVQQFAGLHAADMSDNSLPTANDGLRTLGLEEGTASFMTSSFNCAPAVEEDSRRGRRWDNRFTADDMPSALLDCSVVENPSSHDQVPALNNRSDGNADASRQACNTCINDLSVPQSLSWDIDRRQSRGLETVIDCNTSALGAVVPDASLLFTSSNGSVCSFDGEVDLASALHGFPLPAAADRDSDLVQNESSLHHPSENMNKVVSQGPNIARVPGSDMWAGSSREVFASSQFHQLQLSQQIRDLHDAQINLDRHVTAESSLHKNIDMSGGQQTRLRGVPKRPRLHIAMPQGQESLPGSDNGNIHETLRGSNGDDRKHGCTTCEKRFKTRGDLRRHVNVVHEKKKLFPCDECGKQFGHSGHLNRHKASHSEERRYACDKCSFRFRQASHLAAHIEHIHSASRGRQHECSICRLRVTSVDALRAHLHTVHNFMRCPVPTCGTVFDSNVELAKHSQFHDSTSLTSPEGHLHVFACAE